MSLALVYNYRHLHARRASSLMTLFGIALVVFVAVATMMLAQGLNKTLQSTGSYDNVIVIRNGASNEIQSGIMREDANVILAEPEVARLGDGKPFSTSDVVVIANLRKRADGGRSNVNVRGVSAAALQLRPAVRIVTGAFPAPGTNQVMVGSAIHAKFSGTDIGQSIRLVGTDWPVVGIFDAGNSAFNSEIWGDSEILMPAFKRTQFSSVTFRLNNQDHFDRVRARLESDRRMQVELKREKDFYADQSKILATFIRLIGGFVSVVFSLGAILGAMITMYSAVSNRVREIGVLRALGFRRSAIFLAFIKECLLISLAGGVLGVLLASLTSWLQVSTANFATFAEIAFGFSLTPAIVAYGLLFALLMGAIGGALPALRASRIKLTDALRAE